MQPACLWSDTHCHFDFEFFSEHRELHWMLAQSHGIKRLLIPGISYEQSSLLESFCAHKPWYFAYGLHPYFLADHKEGHIDMLYELVQMTRPIAIGECGLDFNISKQARDEDAHRKAQQQYFNEQIQLAKQFKLPLILHSVKAHHAVLEALKSNQFDCGGVVHGFSGSLEQAKGYASLNIKLGIGGLIAKTNNYRLKEIVRALTASAFLLETDSPDMPPDFSSNRQSSPVFIALYAQIIAHLKQMTLSELAIQMEQQWQKTFKNYETSDTW